MEITRRSFVLGMGTSAFAGLVRPPLVFAGETPRNLISVADYGALPNGRDAGPGVNKAISALPKTGGATLLFPPGRYHFRKHSGYAISLEGIDDLVLEGAGATFLFESAASPMHILNCDQLLLRGFTIDFERPPFSQGLVSAVDNNAHTADIRLDPEYPVSGTEQVVALATFDRSTGVMASHGIDVYGIVDKVSPLGPGAVRIHLKWPLPQLVPGATIVLRHSVYGNHAISLGHCNNPRFQDVQICAAGGMGVVGSFNTDVSFDRLRIQSTPGTRRLMSTNADGVHLTNGQGRVTLNDCLLASMGDDAINVNTSYLRLADRIDARTATVVKFDKSPFKPTELVRVGFPVTLISATTVEKLGEAVVVGVDGGQQETLHFNADLPANLEAGDLLVDTSQTAALTVTGCIFPGNRGRGVVAHNDVLVQGCKFWSQSNEAVLLMPEAAYTGEGPSANNARVTDNEMEDSWRQGPPASGIASGAVRVSAIAPGDAPGLVNQNIEISRNSILRSGANGIVVNYTQNFIVDKNRLEDVSGAAFAMEKVRDGTVTGNVCTPPRQVSIDAGSRDSVSFQGNTGLL